MKSYALFAGALFLVGAVVRQTSLPAPLAKDLEKLSSAPSLKVSYTFRQIGESPTDYKLELSKPNLFRLSSESGFTLSDGKTIYTYTKKDNRYTETAIDDDSIAAFAKRPEVFPWSGFLLKKAGEDFATAKAGTDRTVQGNEVSPVDVTMKKGGLSGTVFVDKKLGVTRGAALKIADKDYLAMATEIEVGTEPTAAEKYAWVAPDGAKKVEAADPNATPTYAAVQDIFNGNCMPCHSAGNRRGGYDFSNYSGIKAGVTPGSSATSAVVIAVKKTGPGKMPPMKSLSQAQIDTISKWIDAGAKNE